MSKKSDQRDLAWARAQFPLLARRSDDEVLRLVREAREQLGMVMKVVVVGSGVMGFLLGFWIERVWLAEKFSGPLGTFFPLAAAVLVGYISALAGEYLVRRRIEEIAAAPPRWK